MRSQSFRDQFDPPLDPGIAHAVEVLAGGGVETYESCEGGEGHSYPEPAVRFHGDRAEGFRALALALQRGLPVKALNRRWGVEDGEPVGPTWELIFWKSQQLTELSHSYVSGNNRGDNHMITATTHNTPEHTLYRLRLRLQTLGEIFEWVQLSEPGTVEEFTIDPGGEVSGYQVIVLDAQTVSYQQTGYLVEQAGWKTGRVVEFIEDFADLIKSKMDALVGMAELKPPAEDPVTTLVNMLSDQQLWILMRVMQAYERYNNTDLREQHSIIARLAERLGINSEIAQQAAEQKVSGIDPERAGALFQSVDDKLLWEASDDVHDIIQTERYGETADD